MLSFYEKYITYRYINITCIIRHVLDDNSSTISGLGHHIKIKYIFYYLIKSLHVFRRGEKVLRAGFGEIDSCRAEKLLSNDIKHVMIG